MYWYWDNAGYLVTISPALFTAQPQSFEVDYPRFSKYMYNSSGIPKQYSIMDASEVQ